MTFLSRLSGYPRLSLLFAGAIGTFGFAPFYVWPCLLISMALLFHIISNALTSRAAFWQSWWWGVGFFGAGLYWITIALTVDMARFGWMIPFALAGIGGGLAIFPAIAGGVYAAFKQPAITINAVLFSCLFFASEWLRSHVLTGFPWNLMGYGWGAYDITAQGASLVGVMGLSLLSWLLACAVVVLFARRFAYPAACVATLSALLFYGDNRLQHTHTQDHSKSITLRLVQANIPQSLKWNPNHLQYSLALYQKLTVSKGLDKVDVVIWPETAFPFVVPSDAAVIEPLQGMLKPHQMLITGAIVSEANVYTNSLLAINNKAKVVARYDKHHLVPFGEYVPLRKWLPIDKITPGMVDFKAGDHPRAMKLKKLERNIRPLICYEVIFAAYSQGKSLSDWLLNITNDGWYGHSTGPYQHLEMARFRAIEQGVPMVRVAGTGISAVYDGYGRLQGSLPLGTQGVLDIALPAFGTHRPFYSQLSD